MNQITCEQCHQLAPSANAFEVNGKLCCKKCADTEIDWVKANGQAVSVTRYVDKAACGRCGANIGEGTDVAQLGNARVCRTCADMVNNWPYPKWLQASAVGLLLLLAIALIHNKKYFDAGKNLYRGEQLVEQGQFEKALPYLTETLKIAPNSDKGALLTAKAAFLAGDPFTADKALDGHNGGQFESADSPEFREVDELSRKAGVALRDLQQAEKLDVEEGKELEAAQLAHAAAAAYPQLKDISLVVDHYDASAAFAKKDYDSFLSISEKSWQMQQTAITAAGVASAFACKYAATGDVSFRRRSEDMVAKAHELATKDDPEALKQLADFDERNRYRLESRNIITRNQYEKKFHPVQLAKN